jgi:hypothetical protein
MIAIQNSKKVLVIENWYFNAESTGLTGLTGSTGQRIKAL